MVEGGLGRFAILNRGARGVLVSHPCVREGVESGRCSVLAHGSGPEPIHLGLMLLSVEVGVLRLGVDIVVHSMMGILWIENRVGCRFEMIDVVMLVVVVVVVNNIGWRIGTRGELVRLHCRDMIWNRW